MSSLLLKSVNIHKNWHPFLSNEIRTLLLKIEKDVLVDDYTPTQDKVLRFLEFPLSAAKIIILGQDPYPQPGVATGRAFEVGNLRSWDQKFNNISLKNILRALYKAYAGKVIKYSELKQEINSAFQVLPPHLLFKHWEKQGVLLLNTSYTCKTGLPGSHRRKWHVFTNCLLKFINEKDQDITWFLWGNNAREATEHLKLKNSIFLMHPMMCYNTPGRKRDFLYGEENCFEPFIGEIDWTGSGK
jgi:uracil-DNA glycosylase